MWLICLHKSYNNIAAWILTQATYEQNISSTNLLNNIIIKIIIKSRETLFSVNSADTLWLLVWPAWPETGVHIIIYGVVFCRLQASVFCLSLRARWGLNAINYDIIDLLRYKRTDYNVVSRLGEDKYPPPSVFGNLIHIYI